jgi:DNA polymerase I-like protein with 3'-5' exonuclease and polymerase domains
MTLALTGVEAPNYFRPWYDISTDPGYILQKLTYLIEHPGTKVSFDTETKGLKPWGWQMTKKQIFFDKRQGIVFMMFRWVDEGGHSQSIGFPWDYDESPLRPFLDDLRPTVLMALECSVMIGHNLTFDALFTMADLGEESINRIAPSMAFDTWHMAYTLRQQRGSLGLELLAYNHCPDIAGYEEDFTLLIELFKDRMHPDNGGHYAMCPPEYWDTHLKSYVMGDVEATWGCWESLSERLANAPSYEIPLAHVTKRGRFRYFMAPSRNTVYSQIISPASRVLIKMMARGMSVDLRELQAQEDLLPKQVADIKLKLKESDPEIMRWCKGQKAMNPDWEFDLENKDVLKELLFDVLNYPVKALTEGGRKIFGEDADFGQMTKEDLRKYAAVDKYTLNALAAEHESIRPLLEYRHLFKAWSSYIRPMRNAFCPGLDKKRREKHQHLMCDNRVHGQFIIPGTRSGRLASQDPNLQQLPTKSTVKRIYNSRWAADGGGIISYDMSQIELRLIAAACGDESMVKAYWDGTDLHSLSMSKIFRRPYEECTKEYDEWLQHQGRDADSHKAKLQRKISKTINFLTSYGGGANGLQGTLAGDSIYFTLEQCEQFLEAFFDSYPTLRNYLSAYKRFIAENGVAVSILGRVRVFEEVFSDDKGLVNKALRAGCNHLIQATASDMMLICLCVVEHLMRQEELESALILTVHDSMAIDFRNRQELPKIHEIAMSVLQNLPEVMQLWFGPEFDLSWMIVPFDGDGEVGKNYYDLRTIPKTSTVDWDALLDAEEHQVR